MRRFSNAWLTRGQPSAALLPSAAFFRATGVYLGVQRIVSRPSKGPQPKKGDKVTVHCTGYITEGRKKFWSTLDTNEPFSFNVGLGKVIKGWDEGVMQMSLGEEAELVMTGDYAYGARGFPVGHRRQRRAHVCH